MTDDVTADSLAASVKSVEPAGDCIEVVVRLSNTATRALHYIADVRATRYDPATRTLVLALSDDGRQVLPGAIAKLPVFRYVDPQSEAQIMLRIPDRLVKLARNVPGELAFEKHQLSDAEQIVVEVAWADVPYYVDTRQKDDMRLPATRWQQHKARATFRLRDPPVQEPEPEDGSPGKSAPPRRRPARKK